MIPSGTPLAGMSRASIADIREARREAFVAAACDAFFTLGYAGTSMSAIASKVGGSKTTLWSYFRSKEDLFAAVVDNIVEQYGQALAIAFDDAAPVAQELRRFAAALMATVLSPPIIALNRIVTGEAGRFPEIGSLFYERGPRRGKARLADYLERAMTAGRLRRGDATIAAQQFAAMCQGGCFQHAVLGLYTTVDDDRIECDIDAAVDSFFRAWGRD